MYTSTIVPYKTMLRGDVIITLSLQNDYFLVPFLGRGDGRGLFSVEGEVNEGGVYNTAPQPSFPCYKYTYIHASVYSKYLPML